MIAALFTILAWKGGLGFSILVGTSGVFYLSISKRRLDNQHSLIQKNVDTVVLKDNEDINEEEEELEL